MITKRTIIISESINPVENLATEYRLLHEVGEDELILFLWQNDKTVVIGRNQDMMAEVNLDALQEIGGQCVRRKSGGGAVYHDMGNLNFTFLAKRHNYDEQRQTQIVLDAICSLGFCAIKNGRNDLTINGRKFSGHSYYKERDACFHNGTILVSTDFSILAKVLTPSKEKLASHGIKSVRSRVVNLQTLNADVTIESVKRALTETFQQFKL